MRDRRDRRDECRLAVDAPALIFWEEGDGGYHVKGKVVNLSGSGLGVQARAPLKPETVVWCAVPSYGIYSRAQVMHARGLLSKRAGLRLLANPIVPDRH
ncbi:MAG: PilZ domain-containing protein [Bryobacteraceae bacterium]